MKLKHLLILPLLFLAACSREDDAPVDHLGEPGDGLVVTIDSRDIIALSPNGKREIRYTLEGYVPADMKVETFSHGLAVTGSVATSLSEGTISLSADPADTSCLNIIFSNGCDLVFKSIRLEGIRASVRDTAYEVLAPGGDTLALDFLAETSAAVSADQDWLSVSGLSVAAEANETDKTRRIAVSITSPGLTGSVNYVLTQEPDPDVQALKLIEEAYDNDFKDFVDRAGGKTHSAQTPMGKHYNNAPAVTQENRIWLSTATNEPRTLNDLPNATYRAYTVKLYPSGTPSPADVNQHSIGDCCACAVWAEMAYLFPDFIKHIIRDNGDGTYTVSMYDPKGTPIEVAVTSKFLGNASGIVQVSGKNNVPTWSTILEKALIKWETCFNVDGIGGIGTEFVVPLYTGNGDSFSFNSGALTNAEMKRLVDVMHHKRMFVIGGFNKNGVAIGTGTTVSGHAYSMLMSSREGCLFAMRNPWGSNGDGSGDGVLNIPDDDNIPKLIDFRIIYPGAAKDYSVKEVKPYK